MGNGYVRIFRNHYYRPERLLSLLPVCVEPLLIDNDELFYRLDTGELFSNDDMIYLRGLSINGYKGKSPIAVHCDNLHLSVSAQLYGKRFFNQVTTCRASSVSLDAQARGLPAFEKRLDSPVGRIAQ